MTTEEKIALLREEWFVATDSLGASLDQREAVFGLIVDAYSQTHRAYHTLDHIAAGLKVLDEHYGGGCDPGYIREYDVRKQLQLARPDIQVVSTLADLATQIKGALYEG